MPAPLLRLSSLDLLKGFVAVGRRMSITMAAEDLCLTQSAVSRQIRALEDQLGVRLLVRKHRSIEFTEEGERLFRSANGALQQLQDVVGEIRKSSARRPVTLTASIGVSGLWLLPRFGRLQQLHPHLDVRLSANNRLIDLRSEGIDLSIRYCADSAAPEGAVRLFGETLAPVAHPLLGVRELSSPQSFARVHLLEFDDPRPWLQWRTCLRERGWQDFKSQGMVHFNQYDQVIQAALAGQGVALGRLELIQPLIANRQLVVLKTAPPAFTSPYAFWLIQAEEHPRVEVRRVAEWIRQEADALVSEGVGEAVRYG